MQPVDRHTLHELQIVAESNRSASILKYFDHTKTPGGSDYLKTLIGKPRETLSDLLSFQDLLKTISADPNPWEIDLPRAYIMAVESYYALNVSHSMSQDVFKHWFDTLIFSIRNPEEFYRIQSGLMAVLKLIRAISKSLSSVAELNISGDIANEIALHQKFLSNPIVKSLLNRKSENLSKRAVFYLDYYFRIKHKENLRQLLDFFYQFDAYTAIVKTAQLHGLQFPEIDPNANHFEIESAWHPLIQKPVSNSFDLTGEMPVCILTGANTSGKTTFLKATGIIIYLAHLGWPVPAKEARMPFFDRLFTSIHLSDDLSSGYSHFSGEIMRIKNMVESLHIGEKCFIIIDELFRGTNQDDALFCSKTVLNGFSGYQGSFFLISTHLLKLIETYEKSPRVVLKCFKTNILGNNFENSFQIESGVATEKVGSLILAQSGMIALFENKKRPSNS